MIFAGPDTFSVMVLLVSRFVKETRSEPVTKVVTDPSEVLRILLYSLFTGKRHPHLEPAE